MDQALIFSSKAYRVEFYSNARNASALVITFTERGNRTLQGTGFGGKFLLGINCDVLAVKCLTDHWYQDFPNEALAAMHEFMKECTKFYMNISSYGSSMGAYAAIFYARQLYVQTVFAISPISTITQPWDSRWAKDAAEFGTFKPIPKNSISETARLIVAYDPHSIDNNHARSIVSLLNNRRIIIVRVPFSGHPSGLTLNKAGCLQPIAFAAFRGDCIPNVTNILRHYRKADGLSHFNVARKCILTNKLKIAKTSIQIALSQEPLNSEYNICAAQVSDRLGENDKAVSYAAIAVAISPQHPHMLATLANLLYKVGHRAAAGNYIDLAIAFDPTVREFKKFRQDFLDAKTSHAHSGLDGEAIEC